MSLPLIMHEKQAALYVGVSRRKLRAWRAQGRLRRLDLGDRFIWYRRADLDELVAGLDAVDENAV